MLLKKLELKGFKSFGEKVTINFNDGITGIVGPNGCGKSNVVDAIRWVLGEQKIKTLRSEKMENIIFNGTKKRKPTQLAEVSLSFTNTKNLLPTEYSEVTITRRYFRSGESEYLLNGIPCRLKDITNLFLDTGITSNSYAIIELGMVDDILNDKDNSRRQLFEQAAGISKFKKRKRETLRKLESTDADLDRVEDLLFEIEKNMKSLEKQARQTERYYKLKEQYKEYSIQLATKLIRKQFKSQSELDARVAEQNDVKTEIAKIRASLEAELEKAKNELVHKEKALSQSQRTLNDKVAEIRHYENEKKIKNERLRYLNDKTDSLKEQIEQDRKSSDRADFSIKSLNTEKEEAQTVLLHNREKLEQLEADYNEARGEHEKLKEEVEVLRKIYLNIQEEVFNAKKSSEIKEIQLKSLKQELEKTHTDTSARSEHLVEFEKKSSELEALIKSKNNELSSLKSEEEATQSEISKLEKTIEVVRQELTDTNRKLDARLNEFSLTKSLVENFEGFPEAIKFLSKSAGWKKNAPLLSDILTCDDDYRVTIENYLEPYLNYYVVDSEAEAYQAINILSDAAKGKANFFILDSFSEFHPSEHRIFDNAFPATEIIEYDTKYKKLMSYILDKVYIVESADIREIEAQHDVTFITKSGKYTKRRFSLSGGSVGLFEGKKIGRAKNLDKLSKEIKKLEKKIQEIDQSHTEKQTELQKKKESLHKTTLESLQDQIRQLTEEYVTIKTKKEQFSEMISHSDLKKEDIEKNVEKLENDLEKILPLLENGEKDLEDHRVKLAKKEEEYNTYNQLLNQRSNAYNEQKVLVNQKENQVHRVEQEISFKEDSLKNSQQRIAQNQALLQKNEAEIKALLEDTEGDDTVLIEMLEIKEKLEAAVNESERTYYSQRGSIDEIEKKIRENQQKRESVDQILMELQNATNEVKLDLTAIKERISVEFNIKTEELNLETEQDDVLPQEELQEKVEKMKNRIENMGPINPMAMEAYEEIRERNEFITRQKDDLDKAKESLLNTIDEIDEVAKKTFLEAFYKIESNFIDVFRSLFTQEDDCDLILTDPENPLESSIEILARPKGKKPLTINQLSGGEKTLTATSLLFAIYLLKPAPFCIFDEVDAPLDDANIDKFNNIVRAFSKDSQFIIVTHNKRTMTSTDIIYGVTMIEQGISRVVPVDLRELA